MACWGILGALFFAQSVIDLFSVEQASNLAGRFCYCGTCRPKARANDGLDRSAPSHCAASNMSFRRLRVFSLCSMCRITHLHFENQPTGWHSCLGCCVSRHLAFGQFINQLNLSLIIRNLERINKRIIIITIILVQPVKRLVSGVRISQFDF